MVTQQTPPDSTARQTVTYTAGKLKNPLQFSESNKVSQSSLASPFLTLLHPPSHTHPLSLQTVEVGVLGVREKGGKGGEFLAAGCLVLLTRNAQCSFPSSPLLPLQDVPSSTARGKRVQCVGIP
ncbi:hypothetical protein E2C01_049419 [Portunus trituberculatus]|uniref:Uncharacterized protein n=1 Tax=Portunus trituberculatus TaxID=210409 RepID=A0A5B7G6C1_PORTR|nr:hypothetical protein [Portunus trituberculatus]